MDIKYRFPGTIDPEITIRRSTLGDLRVLVNGIPAKHRDRRGLSYDVPMSDGSVRELQLKGRWGGLKAVVNGVETPLEPPVPPYTLALAALPLLLVPVGGALGAVVGCVAAAINAGLARQSMRLPLKVVAMLGVTALSVALYFGSAIAFAVAITPVPTLETGTCVNGIRDGATVTADTTRPVDCATAHDNEVAGSILYTGEGGYPGAGTLQAFGEAPCIEAVRAYVGDDSVLATLSLILVTPSNLTWAKGDRNVGCVVLAGDGGQLTGTVKGSGQ